MSQLIIFSKKSNIFLFRLHIKRSLEIGTRRERLIRFANWSHFRKKVEASATLFFQSMTIYKGALAISWPRFMSAT